MDKEEDNVYKNIINTSSTTYIEDDGKCIKIVTLKISDNDKLEYKICKNDKEKMYNQLKNYFKFSMK
jgi:hypothetical protein